MANKDMSKVAGEISVATINERKASPMRKLALVSAVLVAAMVGLASTASNALAFGQCGPGTRSPSTWVKQIKKMGVTSQTGKVEKSAGFHRMDGSLSSWAKERVIAAPLAKAANPEDFGCHPGELFSVGHRSLPKGTVVLVALPAKFAKSDVSLHHCSGCKKLVLKVHIVAKTNCANPERGVVLIVVYVHQPHKPPAVCKPGMMLKNGKCVQPPPVVVCQPPNVVINGVCTAPPPKAHFTAHAVATATASATCPDGTTATASGYGEGWGESDVSQQDADDQANAKAHANAAASAEASVHCAGGPPPNAPSIVSITMLNDVDAGGNSPNFCATVDMPGSDTGTLIMSPTYGNFGSSGTATFTVSGTDKVCATYFAPTEVPSGGMDTITVTLRDNVNGLSATPQSTTFRINPPPVNPPGPQPQPTPQVQV